MDSKVLHIIKSNGCTIRLDIELQMMHPAMWIQATLKNAYGLFSPSICQESIFLFNFACPVESTDYVLAHEFGHYMSCKMSYGVHGLFKNKEFDAINNDYSMLIIEDEFRADTFAVALSSKMGFEVPQWVFTNRISHYESKISEERRRELSAEVDLMLSSSLFTLEQAA